MFDKFEAFMNKYLTPLANKMDKQVHLSAVKKAMVAMTPLLIYWEFLFDSRSYSKYDWRKQPSITMDFKQS